MNSRSVNRRKQAEVEVGFGGLGGRFQDGRGYLNAYGNERERRKGTIDKRNNALTTFQEIALCCLLILLILFTVVLIISLSWNFIMLTIYCLFLPCSRKARIFISFVYFLSPSI